MTSRQQQIIRSLKNEDWRFDGYSRRRRDQFEEAVVSIRRVLVLTALALVAASMVATRSTPSVPSTVAMGPAAAAP